MQLITSKYGNHPNHLKWHQLLIKVTAANILWQLVTYIHVYRICHLELIFTVLSAIVDNAVRIVFTVRFTQEKVGSR